MVQLKVSDNTAAATFTIFDREAQKLLGTTATELKSQQDGNNFEMSSKLQNLCNHILIFEVKMNNHNLKEGSHNYTVTKTFVPNSKAQPLFKQIKQVTRIQIQFTRLLF